MSTFPSFLLMQFLVHCSVQTVLSWSVTRSCAVFNCWAVLHWVTVWLKLMSVLRNFISSFLEWSLCALWALGSQTVAFLWDRGGLLVSIQRCAVREPCIHGRVRTDLLSLIKTVVMSEMSENSDKKTLVLFPQGMDEKIYAAQRSGYETRSAFAGTGEKSWTYQH